MKHIAYLSQAVRPLSDQDLAGLLAQCRRDNARLGITGILFYSHGHIAQLFEGDPETVETLFERITHDSRHTQVRQLLNRFIAARNFPEWSMAFHPLDAASFATLEGFLLPASALTAPATLHPADALVLNLVRQAVFSPTGPLLTTWASR